MIAIDRVATVRELLALARSIAHLQSAVGLIGPADGHPLASEFTEAMINSGKSLSVLLQSLDERTKDDGA